MYDLEALKKMGVKPIHGEHKPENGPDDIQPVPPVACEFRPGDRVLFTNDYGATFERTVVGFSPTVNYGRFVYLDTDCWWFPVDPSSLKALPATEAR